MARIKRTQEKNSQTPPPGKTMELREAQLIASAVDLAEKQLQAGTASAQVITHFLRLGSTSERLEKEKLSLEADLLKAKRQALDSAKNVETLYAEALKAMSKYNGEYANGGDTIIDD
jgi:hypothetical protein